MQSQDTWSFTLKKNHIHFTFEKTAVRGNILQGPTVSGLTWSFILENNHIHLIYVRNSLYWPAISTLTGSFILERNNIHLIMQETVYTGRPSEDSFETFYTGRQSQDSLGHSFWRITTIHLTYVRNSLYWPAISRLTWSFIHWSYIVPLYRIVT